MDPLPLDADALVEDIMRRWPATIAVFLRHRMACIGCPAGPFHSVADSAAAYGVETAALLEELRAVVAP